MKSNHEDKYKNIGLKIQKFREENNMTQVELAEKLGISLSHLTKIEAKNCSKSFSLALLFDIAVILNKDIKDFFD